MLAVIITYMSPCVFQSSTAPLSLACWRKRGAWDRPTPPLPLRPVAWSSLLPEIVGLGMLLLLEGLLELALLAQVLVDAAALLGVAQRRPSAAVGVQAVRARRLLGLLDVVCHRPVDLVTRADWHRHRVVALVLWFVVAPLRLGVLGRLAGVRQPLVVRLGVSSRAAPTVVLSGGVGDVLEMDVGAVRVPLSLAVRRPVVDQGVSLQASLVSGHRAQGVLLDVLQLLLAAVLLVVVETLLAVLVGLVQLAPGLAAFQLAVRLLLRAVLLGLVVVGASERRKADNGQQHHGRQV